MHKDTLIYLASYYEIKSEVRGDKRWWAFSLTCMATSDLSQERFEELLDDQDVYRYTSHDTARNFAEGWISRKLPELFGRAEGEAILAEKYRANESRKAMGLPWVSRDGKREG